MILREMKTEGWLWIDLDQGLGQKRNVDQGLSWERNVDQGLGQERNVDPGLTGVERLCDMHDT